MNLSWITPGVGSALSGFFTATGAILAVLLAQAIFRGRITDLKSAIAETERTIVDFQQSVDNKLRAFQESISVIDATISALQESAARTQIAVYDSQEIVEEVLTDDGEVAVSSPKDQIRSLWNEISSHLEEIASSENIDGRRRARYGRIDRRSYYELIDSLENDGYLGRHANSIRSATELWYSCRRKNEVDRASIEKMQAFRNEVTQIPVP